MAETFQQPSEEAMKTVAEGHALRREERGLREADYQAEHDHRMAVGEESLAGGPTPENSELTKRVVDTADAWTDVSKAADANREKAEAHYEANRDAYIEVARREAADDGHNINIGEEVLSETAKAFKDAIDAKFAEVEAGEGEIGHEYSDREHEQTVQLDRSAFPHISDDAKIFATRPIPAETEEAAQRWEGGLNGPRINIFEPRYQHQQTFLIVGGELASRGLMPGDSTMGYDGIPMHDSAREAAIVASVEQAQAHNVPPLEARAA